MNMKVNVWDTYVKRKDGGIMHFDIITLSSDADEVYQFGKHYLISKGQEGQSLASDQCSFCHVESVKPEWEASILKEGYVIYEMEGCQ